MNPCMYNVDIVDYFLQNATPLKEEIEPIAIRFFELKPFFNNEFEHIFNDKYQDFFCMLLCEKLYGMLNDFTYEELRVTITPELITELLGSDYFEYE